MGFDPHWLSLREPADGKARDQGLLLLAKATMAKSPGGIVLDIGCGSGSTYRGLQPFLDETTSWRLLDNDPLLLEEFRRRHGNRADMIEMNLADVDALPLQGVALVTASALFDLCSADFIERISRRLAVEGIGLYAALNYDGDMAWSDRHPLDDAVTAVFNAHQRSDKGFGVSLGPDAWHVLAEAMGVQGSQVSIAESPWMLTKDDADLQLLLLNGIVAAVQERDELEPGEVATWHDFRRHAVIEGTGLCRIGHRDVLALP